MLLNGEHYLSSFFDCESPILSDPLIIITEFVYREVAILEPVSRLAAVEDWLPKRLASRKHIVIAGLNGFHNYFHKRVMQLFQQLFGVRYVALQCFWCGER